MTFLRRAAQIGLFAVLAGAVGAMGWAWLAGWRLNVVESESMAPILHRNSLAIVVPTVGTGVGRGDVIAFREGTRDGPQVIHRVSKVFDHGQVRFYETKGDANPTPDGWVVPAAAIDGRLIFHLGHVGVLIRALAPPRGLVVLVGLPLVLGLVSEVRHRRRSADAHCPTCGSWAAFDASSPVGAHFL
ncbi:MAG: signal peptidase [Actinomycetota bacterium]